MLKKGLILTHQVQYDFIARFGLQIIRGAIILPSTRNPVINHLFSYIPCYSVCYSLSLYQVASVVPGVDRLLSVLSRL